MIILNDECSSKVEHEDGLSSHQISSKMRSIITKLKGRFMSEDGSSVDYAGLGKSEEFKAYCSTVYELRHVDLSTLSQDELKCFFLNIYNSLTIHALVHQSKSGNVPTPKNVADFWSIHCYKIGGYVYNLDDMEHGVLRANKGHPSAGTDRFSASDERRNHIVSQLDPRIHFGLNCGATSCPPIRLYTPDKIDSQLDTATISFLSQEVTVKEDGEVEMSKLLLWYGKDFGQSDLEILQWINKVVGDKIPGLQHSLHNQDHPPTIIFKDYNWDVNSTST